MQNNCVTSSRLPYKKARQIALGVKLIAGRIRYQGGNHLLALLAA
jgi:hypothetical protein